MRNIMVASNFNTVPKTQGSFINPTRHPSEVVLNTHIVVPKATSALFRYSMIQRVEPTKKCASCSGSV